MTNSIFKQYYGSLGQFKDYYVGLSPEQKTALSGALVFIHDAEVDGNWNNDGYIFANGRYYTCRETNLTADTLKNLIASGSTEEAGVTVEVVDGKLVFTPCLKEELKSLTSVGFVETGKTWAAGTPIEQILNDIFAKEVWYPATSSTVAYSDVITSSIPKPTLTVNVDNVNITSTTTCEIGAPITLSGALNVSTVTYKDNFTVTCNATGSDGSTNNGFALHGESGYPTSGATTSASIPMTTGSTGSDALSITTHSGGFVSAYISDNELKFATDGEAPQTQYVQAGTNTIAIKSTSKTYTATANPGDNQKYLYTVSNKGNYPTAATMEGVDVKEAITKTQTETPTNTASITINGAYKYYYVWSAASQPTIPASFSGDLEGWTENWGTKTINTTATAMNDIAWVLKPTGTAPTIVEPTTGAVTSFETISTHTNKYGTSYTLYRFPKTSAGSAGGANYKDMKLN